MITKGISLKQPWASLVAMRLKRFETRSWRTNYRGPLVVCSSKSIAPPEEFHPDIRDIIAAAFPQTLLRHGAWAVYESLPFGKALCVVDLVDCIRAEDLQDSEIVAEKQFGNFAPGRFVFKLANMRVFQEPWPIKGSLGIFNMELPDEYRFLL